MKQNSKILAGFLFLFLMLFLPYVLLLFGYELTFCGSIRHLILHETLMWVVLLMMTLYANYIEKQDFILTKEQNYSFGWHLRNFWLLYLGVILIGILVKLVVTVLHVPTESVRLNLLLEFLKGNRWLIPVIAITAGVTEELLVRGYLFTRLEKIFHHPWPAILVSSILFGVMHFGYGTLQQLLFPLFFGVLFSWHYSKYRNLKVLILVHSFVDLISMMAGIR